jgi:hypothetical protein
MFGRAARNMLFAALAFALGLTLGAVTKRFGKNRRQKLAPIARSQSQLG